MTGLLVGVPVLARPQNAAPLVANLRETTPGVQILFLCSRGDKAEIKACQSLGRTLIVGEMNDPGQWASKHNAGFRIAVDDGYEWYFCGSDDLTFHPGWWEACVARHDETGACVIGTNDGHNPNVVKGMYATHFLVNTDYAECGVIDDPTRILHEGYDHQSVDIEFCQTAIYRRTYAHAYAALVEHRHVHWGLAEMDSTYEKALRATAQDQALFNARRHMWRRRRKASMKTAQEEFVAYAEEVEGFILAQHPDFPPMPRPLPRFPSPEARAIVETLLAVLLGMLNGWEAAEDGFARAQEWCS